MLLDKFDPSSKDNRWRRTIFASSDVRTKTQVDRLQDAQKLLSYDRAVVAYDNTINSQHMFRSHNHTPPLRSAEGPLNRIASASPQYIWEVVRAACAAPFYFTPIELDGHTFSDGGMVVNNPSIIALDEILASHNDSTITMISIRSGLRNRNIQSGKPQSHGFFSTMRKCLATVINLLTDTQITHKQVSEIIKHTGENHKYHRLNDDGLLGDIQLNN
jgi:predicted patatin/cPLA2 family phospholipase